MKEPEAAGMIFGGGAQKGSDNYLLKSAMDANVCDIRPIYRSGSRLRLFLFLAVPGIQRFDAFGTDAVTKICLGIIPYVSLNLLPVTVVIPYLFALRAESW